MHHPWKGGLLMVCLCLTLSTHAYASNVIMRLDRLKGEVKEPKDFVQLRSFVLESRFDPGTQRTVMGPLQLSKNVDSTTAHIFSAFARSIASKADKESAEVWFRTTGGERATYMSIHLKKHRIESHNVRMVDGEMVETFEIGYDWISVKYFTFDKNGKPSKTPVIMEYANPRTK